ncbi:MAG: zinc-ribbon domain-containing protein [Chloroflexia bacterium]
MSNLICPSCGSEVDAGALLCPKCGRPNISTAFAGEYSTPGAQTAREMERGVEQSIIPLAPSDATPTGGLQPTPATTLSPAQPGGGIEDTLTAGTASPVYTPGLPASLRPGTLYASSNVMVKEVEQEAGSGPLPAPQAHATVGGQQTQGSGLPAPTRHDREQTLRVRQRETFDVSGPTQPQQGYGAGDRGSTGGTRGWSRSRKTGTQPVPSYTGILFAAACFLGLTFFLAVSNFRGLACILPLVAGYLAILWWRASSSRGR